MTMGMQIQISVLCSSFVNNLGKGVGNSAAFTVDM